MRDEVGCGQAQRRPTNKPVVRFWRVGIALDRTLLAALVLCCSSAFAENTSTVKLGTEGVYLLRWKGPPLEAKPVDDRAPLVLRIARVRPDGDSSIYELRYIGSRPGKFDLRDSLHRAGGRPIAAGEMETMPVAIQGILPNDHDGELVDRGVANVAWPWPYRAILAGVAILWAVPLVLLIARRVFRRRPEQVIVLDEKPLTLADQLRPLVEAAVAGRMTTHEQARLERMLIAFWREQLDLAGLPMHEALARLRGHEPSADLLDHLDHWLHDRPGRYTVDVAAVLGPYRGHAPLKDADLAGTTLTGDELDSADLIDRALVKEVSA